MIRVPVKPELLRWARHRAGLGLEAFPALFKQLPEWEEGSLQPTLKQLEDFARKTHVPLGYLFLDEPPEETIPIPDLRTVCGRTPQPSPNLLDTIYLCQERQAWYQDYLRSVGAEPLDFVGSGNVSTDPRIVAEAMHRRLRFPVDQRLRTRTQREAISAFIAAAEAIGILVMVSGVAGSNPRRKLDPSEFRGITLADPLGPLVFVNGADARSAQMFTLAHGLAHVWLGASAISNVPFPTTADIGREETWCNAVAAEFLVPLARIDKARFEEAWTREATRHENARKAGGGYRTTLAYVSKPFVRAVIADTLEGGTRYTDAFRLLGVRSSEDLDRMARELGMAQANCADSARVPNSCGSLDEMSMAT